MDMSPVTHSKMSVLEGRRAERRTFSGEIMFRKGVKRAMVQVRDISEFGARVGGVSFARN